MYDVLMNDKDIAQCYPVLLDAPGGVWF